MFSTNIHKLSAEEHFNNVYFELYFNKEIIKIKPIYNEMSDVIGLNNNLTLYAKWDKMNFLEILISKLK